MRPSSQGDAEALIGRLASAMTEGDIDRVMELFGEDPFIRIIPPPPEGKDSYEGRSEVREALQEFIDLNFRMEFEVLEVEDDTVTTRTTSWHDITRRLGVAPLTGTEEYVIRDGLIQGFTYRFSDEDLERIRHALEGSEEAG